MRHHESSLFTHWWVAVVARTNTSTRSPFARSSIRPPVRRNMQNWKRRSMSVLCLDRQGLQQAAFLFSLYLSYSNTFSPLSLYPAEHILSFSFSLMLFWGEPRTLPTRKHHSQHHPWMMTHRSLRLWPSSLINERVQPGIEYRGLGAHM